MNAWRFTNYLCFIFTFTNENRNQIEFQTKPDSVKLSHFNTKTWKRWIFPIFFIYFMTKKRSLLQLVLFFSGCFPFSTAHKHSYTWSRHLQHFNLSTLIIISVSMFVIAYLLCIAKCVFYLCCSIPLLGFSLSLSYISNEYTISFWTVCFACVCEWVFHFL